MNDSRSRGPDGFTDEERQAVTAVFERFLDRMGYDRDERDRAWREWEGALLETPPRG